MLAFRADYVFPVEKPPIRDGVVAIDHDRIVAVGESKSPSVRDFLPAARNLGRVAILPGLVNPHTHLEFSDLRRPLGTPGMEFTKWIGLVVQHNRESQQKDQLRSSRVAGLAHYSSELSPGPVALGLEESCQQGVTALGDIRASSVRRMPPVDYPKQNNSLAAELTTFLELISLSATAVDTAFRVISEELKQSPQQWNSEICWGISPHAPYTVHPELLGKCARLSAERKIPLAHHLAESRDELMLLRTGRGPFVGLLEALQAWDPEAIPFASRPLDYLKVLSEAHRALIIHGNYLDDQEIDFLAAHADRMSVVYCPRTHAFFQHDAYPLAKMLLAGVNVALGTDSRASNPDLSILSEMRFAVKQHPVVPPATLLCMITSYAAKALGREAEIGTLTPGKFADMAMIALPSHDAAEPHELLLDLECDVVATIFRGRAVHGEKILLS
jgi:cytosine/adenosine deaminase-related metal-dependent hydrolase